MMNDVGATARCRSTALARRRLAAGDGAATARERRRQPARRPWRRQRQHLHTHHTDSISLTSKHNDRMQTKLQLH